MVNSPHDQSCLHRWQAGDEQAAAQLYHRYVERLVAVARVRLSSKLSARLDPEDIVQSVFRTFFCRAQQGRFVFKEADDIWRLLVQITVNKTLKQIDFHYRGKRNPNVEVSPSPHQEDLRLTSVAKDPTPAEAFLFMDELDHFLEQLRPEDRTIIKMRLEGYDNVEIAKHLCVSDRKIRRLMERLRGLAQQAPQLA